MWRELLQLGAIARGVVEAAAADGVGNRKNSLLSAASLGLPNRDDGTLDSPYPCRHRRLSLLCQYTLYIYIYIYIYIVI
jgi:hypothetical protein